MATKKAEVSRNISLGTLEFLLHVDIHIQLNQKISIETRRKQRFNERKGKKSLLTYQNNNHRVQKRKAALLKVM